MIIVAAAVSVRRLTAITNLVNPQQSKIDRSLHISVRSVRRTNRDCRGGTLSMSLRVHAP